MSEKKEEKISFKDKFLKFKNKALELKDKAVEFSASKISQSSIVIKDEDELKEIIEKTTPKEFFDEKTKKTKIFKKYAVIIFTSKTDKDFFKNYLAQILVLSTKAWSQSIVLKICNLYDKPVKKYKVEKFPSLVVFENKKVVKVLDWEETIKKIVKTIDFDIIKLLEVE